MHRVGDLLKNKPKEVFSVSPKASVFDALTIMSEKDIGALMVMSEQNKVAGIITRADFLRALVSRTEPPASQSAAR